MFSSTTSSPALLSGTHVRRYHSVGMKLLLVCGLSIAMLLPTLLVEGLLSGRNSRADSVKRELSTRAGGEQVVLGPTLAVPYVVPSPNPSTAALTGMYLVFPSVGSATVHTAAEQRRRSLFKMATYRADAAFQAHFDLSAAIPAPAEAILLWNRAEVILGLGDTHGLLTQPALETRSGKQALQPVQELPSLAFLQNGTLGTQADENALLHMPLLGTSMPNLDATSSFDVTAHLSLSGAERLTILPFAQTTSVRMDGDWRSPGFEGATLPANSTVKADGFTARWFLPLAARQVRAAGPLCAITGLREAGIGVQFLASMDAYRPVERSLKYSPLFIIVVFLTYFLLEVTSGKSVHPAQYVLVGAVQVIFYLLLLSLAERLGFDVAYALAGMCTVLLLAAYVRWVFASRAQAGRAFAGFALLYTLIFLLLDLEDNALLIGSLASFVAVAALMWLTRHLDWYASFGTVQAAAGGDEARVV